MPVLYTIGHSNHSLEHFIELLRIRNIEVLIDVRSAPYSRYVSHFNKTSLEKELESTGIVYLYLGRQLGGRAKSQSKQSRKNSPADGPAFEKGISTVEKIAEKQLVALMCAEENPLRCHRFHLITPVLTSTGLTVRHIRGDGRIERDEALRIEASLQSEKKGQLELF